MKPIKPRSILLAIGFLTLVLVGEGLSFPNFTKPIKEPYYIQALPVNGNNCLALSPTSLYWVEKDGSPPKRLFRLRKSDELRKVLVLGDRFFLLSEHQLYLSDDGGRSWKDISPRISDTARLKTMEIIGTKFFLGASDGLYTSGLEIFQFKKADAFPPNEPILRIRGKSSNIYFVLTDRGLYKTRDGGASFDKLLGDIPKETENDETEIEEPSEIQAFGGFASLEIDPTAEKVWVGSDTGVFESAQGGLNFRKLPSAGLLSPKITALAWTPEGLLAGTRRGIYLLGSASWKMTAPALGEKKIFDLFQQNGNLWVSYESGFDRVELEPSPQTPNAFGSETQKRNLFVSVKKLIADEPSALAVQKAAIRYSHTPNGKIRSWQVLSRLKTLLPDVSYSVGKTRANTIDIDRGGTADEDVYILGPEDWGRSQSVGVSWDLGELLFSSNQTSIDSREKLMVELRDEIVCEVTRLYYERRRLQIELLSENYTGEKLIDTSLRIEELTAQIDGLTGSWFSKHSKNRQTLADIIEKSFAEIQL